MLASFGDVIRLAIFAHTHMDELRLLLPESKGDGAAEQPGVALKMIPSISPVDGNLPSFVVGQVDPATGTLKDYQVIAASNATGTDTKWAEEYDFDREYHQAAFNASAVSALIAGFHTDRAAQTPASESYLKNYFDRDQSIALKIFWPQYVCALDNTTTETYRSCICASEQ